MSDAHSHSHAPSTQSLAGDPRARRALAIALGVGLVVLVGEVAFGIAFGSLALLGDAAHMATDVTAYAIALWAARAAGRPPSATRTFGHGRTEIFAALVNGATLLAASAWILVEAIRRLVDPTQVDGGGMSVVAAVGLAANVVVLVVLLRAGSSSLNMRGAVLHAAGDLLGSVAAVIAGVVIATTGWTRADPLASIALTVLILVGAWRLVRQSAAVLVDSAPPGLDADRVADVLVAADGVLEAHDVHVWTLAPGTLAASAHVRVGADADRERVLDALALALRLELGITHTTIQLRSDRGAAALEAVPLMAVEDAIEWATDHVSSANPDLSRAVISAAAGAAAVALGGAAGRRVSPVALSSRTLASLGRGPAQAPDDHA
jgi:cobalt-zinc-cadmium efflux system protein